MKQLQDFFIETKPAFLMKIYLKRWNSEKSSNLQILATEICKVKNDLAPGKDKSYDLENNATLKRKCNRWVYMGTETISALAPKIWELVSSAVKNAISLELFKNQIKQ